MEKTNTVQKLTQAKINKFASKLNEKRKVYFNIENETFEITVQNKFTRVDLESVYVEYVQLLYKLNTIKDVDDEALLSATRLLYTLVLRKFTNLPIPKTEDVGKLIGFTKNIANLGLIEFFFGDGESSGEFGEENIKLFEDVLNKASDNTNRALQELGIMEELKKIEDEVDVDNYFSELEAKNFEITEDEDLEMLSKVIDKLNETGKYDEYMGRLTDEEIELLKKRFELIKNKDKENEV